MSTRTLLILMIVTVAVLAAGVLSWSRRNPPAAPVAENGLLLPDLPDRVNAAAAIVVTGRQGAFEVRKLGEGRWGLADRGGYPVQFEKVREVLVGLSQLRVLEPKTSKPENYGRIGVGDPATDEKATGISVRDGSGAVLADVILGDRTWQGQEQQRYVRRQGEASAWLAEGRVEVADAPLSWVDQNILRLGRDRIRSVSILHPDGERLEAVRPDKAARDFQVQDLPPDRELNSVGAANVLGSAFSFVRFEDVRPEGPEAPVPTEATVVTVHAFDGLSVEIRMGPADGRTWARMSASFDAAATEPAPAEGGEAPAEPAEQKEARELQEKLTGWVFEFSEATAEKFTKRMSDLTKAREPAPAAPPAAPPDAEPASPSSPDEESPLPQPAAPPPAEGGGE